VAKRLDGSRRNLACLGLGHIVLDGDPPPPPPKGHSPQFSAHVCCGQMVGWIKMPLGMKVGLGPGDFVLHGNPAPLPKKGTEPPRFGPCLLWPNGWIKMALGVEIGLGQGHIVLDEDPNPLPKRGVISLLISGPFLLWPNGWMHQDATWYGGRPRPRPHYARWGPSSPPPKKRGNSPQFSAHVYCGQTAGWIKM